jgi:ribulose-phosphate 3-epimerase
MATIVPSILETSYDKFLATYSQELKLPGVQRIQVDFGDGIFIPHALIPVTEIDALTPAIHWEAHLMVNEPRDFLDYKISGFNTVIIHYEAYGRKEDLLNAIHSIMQEGMEPAVCIKTETPVSVLAMFEGQVRQFQIMGVHPGLQGQAFLPEAIGRIRELRRLIPGAIIELDGGMQISNIRSIAEAGADLIIAGSAITKAPNMLEAYEKLTAEILSISSSAGRVVGS